MEDLAVNLRERISAKGWQTKDTRLIELAHLDEWRSMTEGERRENLRISLRRKHNRWENQMTEGMG